MLLAAAAILGVGLAVVWPPVMGLSSEDRDQLAGCLDQSVLEEHVSELADADWRGLDRTWVMERWPNRLDFSAREPGTNEILGFEQRGRVINHEVQCGITYLFTGSGSGGKSESVEPNDPYRLRSVTVRQADTSRERVLALAQRVTDATGAPPDAKGTWSTRFDGGDRRPVVFSSEYAWPSEKYRQLLLVKVLQADDIFILEVTWNAEAE